MDSARLQQECADIMATALIELFGSVLRDDERNEAIQEMVHVCKTGIESYVIQRNRNLQKLSPSRN